MRHISIVLDCFAPGARKDGGREITMTVSPITAVIARWYCTGIHITASP